MCGLDAHGFVSFGPQTDKSVEIGNLHLSDSPWFPWIDTIVRFQLKSQSFINFRKVIIKLKEPDKLIWLK